MAALGALVATALVPFAARRAMAQPVAFDVDAEARLLAAAAARTGIASGSGLPADAFTAPARRDRWVALLQAEADGATNDDVVLAPSERNALESVAACHEDRTTYPGRTPLVETTEADRPLRRTTAPYGLARRVLAGVAGAVTGYLVAAVFGPGWFAAAAAVMAAGALVVSLVDHDTLLVDLESYAVLYALAWVFAFAGSFQAGTVALAVVGAGTGLFMAATMGALAFVAGRLRNKTMLGGGDPILMISAAGLPVALTGQAGAAPAALMIACGIGIGTWVIKAVRSGATTSTPFAFGPGIVLGGLIATLLFA